MRKALSTLAEIRGGYSFRSSIGNVDVGSIAVLQIKDLKQSAEIDYGGLPHINWSFPGEPPLLRTGDIVLPARGEHYSAVIPCADIPIVASSQLYVLQPDVARVLPAYLCWYLNQPGASNYILKNRVGTGIPMLGLSALSSMPIPLPPLGVQRRIADMNKLLQREQALTQQLLETRRKTLDGVCHQLLES